jgi:hypothetical protein
MFKLLKDLTRPPEPLGGRSRSASLSTGVTAPAPSPAPAPPPPPEVEDEPETDADARNVIELVDGLPDVRGTMAFVEVSGAQGGVGQELQLSWLEPAARRAGGGAAADVAALATPRCHAAPPCRCHCD